MTQIYTTGLVDNNKAKPLWRCVKKRRRKNLSLFLPFAEEVLVEEYLEVEEYLSELFEVALVVVVLVEEAQQQKPQVSRSTSLLLI